MDPQTALDELVQVEAEIARLHARQAELLVAVADPAPRIDEYRILEPRADRGEERLVRIEDAVREEVAAALRWSPATAQARIDAARLLLGPLVDTRAALAAGQISYAHARIVVDAVERLSTRLDPSPRAQVRFIGQCVQLQHRVLPVARRGTLARTRRDVWIGTACDGIAPLIAHLDTITARATLILGTGSPVRVTAEVQVTIPVDQLTGDHRGPEIDGLAPLLADPAIRCTLRDRPRPALGRRRTHRRPQPRRALHPTPPTQDPGRLADHRLPTRRILHLDLTPGPHLRPQPAALLRVRRFSPSSRRARRTACASR